YSCMGARSRYPDLTKKRERERREALFLAFPLREFSRKCVRLTHCCRMAPVFGSFERIFTQTVRSYPFSMCLKNRWMVRGVTDSKPMLREARKSKKRAKS